MSVTLGMLADRFAKASGRVQPVTDQQIRTLAQVGVGYMKSAIQNVHAVDTSTMLNSTTVEKTSGGYLIGPTVRYAPYVALGTSRMAARPFHLHAAKRLQSAINQGDILRDLGL